MLDEIYKKYVEDNSIISLLQLAKFFNIIEPHIKGSRKLEKFKKNLYDKFGKIHIKTIGSKRRAKIGGDGNKKYKGSSNEEIYGTERAIVIKKKQSEGLKRNWLLDDGSRRDISRALILKNAIPIASETWVRNKAISTRRERENWANYSKEGYASLVEKNQNKIITDETREKMSKAAKERGYNLPNGFTHSETTKRKLSKITKKQWEDGIHIHSSQSKGQLELSDILEKTGYTIESEYLLDGRPFDIKIGNLLIEFNGTYWHLDPRFYSTEYSDNSRNSTEIWNRDLQKRNIAIENGYELIVVWQSDWETNQDNELKRVIKVIENDRKVSKNIPRSK